MGAAGIEDDMKTLEKLPVVFPWKPPSGRIKA